MSKMIVDRDFLSLPLTGIQFGVYMSAMDLGTIYRERILLSDVGVYYNMMDRLPNPKQRKEVNDALEFLIDEGHIVADEVGRGLYLVDCQKSFNYDLSHLPHGGQMLIYSNIKKVMTSGSNWQGMLRYYLMVAGHMKRDGTCSYSRQYFASKLKINEASVTKYNTILKNIGVLDIVRQKNEGNIYKLT